MTLTQINKAGLDELALDHVFTIGASGSDHYTFQGEGLNGTVNDPTLYLTRGKTYRFENGTGAHPIRIQSTSGASGTAYNTGVTNNAGSGTVIVEVQHDAPDVLYYQCTSHAAMNGVLYITGALADGGVTTAKLAADAVDGTKIADNAINSEHYTDGSIDTAHIADNQITTSKIADSQIITAKINDDAVTTAKIAAGAVGNTEIASTAINSAKIDTGAVTAAKIAANAVGSSQLSSGSVTTAKIADDAVTSGKISNSAITNSKVSSSAAISGTKLADNSIPLAKLPNGDSNNNGKFLRANNGAGPSFETVSIPAGTTINNNADNRVITGSGTANTLEGESNVVVNGGKLGIGVASPDVELHVQGTGDGMARITSADGSSAFLDLGDVSDKDGGRIQYNTDSSLRFSTASSERMRIDNAGRFGVGTTSPSQLAHFYHATDNGLLRLESGDSQARITLEDSAGETHIGAVGNDTVMWQGTGMAETLRVANGGEVTKPRTPFFWAYNSSDYSWNGNTITFETEANDVGGNYNNSTYTFTCPTAGIYMFVVYFRAGGGFGEFSWTLQKNGGNFIRIIGQGSFSGNDCHFGTTIQACSVNDAWRVHGSGSHGGATGGYPYNGFQGYLLG